MIQIMPPISYPSAQFPSYPPRWRVLQFMIAEPGLVTQAAAILGIRRKLALLCEFGYRGALAAAMYARLACGDVVRLSVPTGCKATVARGLQWSNDGVQS